MQTFKDTTGREWSVTITVADVETLIDLVGVDVGKPADIRRIFDDTTTFIRTLFTLLQDQIDERKLTPTQVKKSFDADTFEKASEALMDAIVLFIPARARRAAEKTLEAIRERQGELQTQVEAKLEAAIQQIKSGGHDAELMPAMERTTTQPMAEIETKAAALRAKILAGQSNFATVSEESSASIPGP